MLGHIMSRSNATTVVDLERYCYSHMARPPYGVAVDTKWLISSSNDYYVYLKPALVEANPDIAGIGVITNFVGTAYITILLLICHYLVVYNPSQDVPISQGSNSRTAVYQSNPIDVELLSLARRLLRIPPSWEKAAPVLNDCILAMCDVQITTGFAILISAFIMSQPSTFSAEPLSAWHWDIVVQLTWFSTMTHLAGLTALRSYLNPYPRIKIARFTLIVLLAILLLVAMIPTGFFNWSPALRDDPATGFDPTCATPDSPAFCYFNIKRGRKMWNEAHITKERHDGRAGDKSPHIIDSWAMQEMIFKVAFFAICLFTRWVKFFPSLSKFTIFYTREALRNVAAHTVRFATNMPFYFDTEERSVDSRQTSGPSLYHDLIIAPLHGISLTLQIQFDLISSTFFEILSILFILAWGTKGLSRDLDFKAPEEYPWGFGQLMAIILLIAPLILVAWKFAEQKKDGPVVAGEADGLLQAVELTERIPREQIEIDDPLPCPADTQSNGTPGPVAVTNTPERDHYASTSLIWPSVIPTFTAQLAVAILFFIFTQQPLTRKYTAFGDERVQVYRLLIVEFLYTDPIPMLPYLLLGCPNTCALTICLGLRLESCHGIKSYQKWIFLLVLGFFTQGILLALSMPWVVNDKAAQWVMRWSFEYWCWFNTKTPYSWELCYGLNKVFQVVVVNLSLWFFYSLFCFIQQRRAAKTRTPQPTRSLPQ